MKTHEIYQKLIQGIAFTFLMIFFTAISEISYAEGVGDNVKTQDTKISNTISKELMYNSTTPSYLIDVETFDGIVTLSGSVDNLLAKDRAVNIAQMVKGVRGVVNEIQVNAPVKEESVLKTDVQRALLYDPATESYEVDVKVYNGTVTLTGEVDSWQERKLSEFVVKSVKGVKAIINNIEVDFDENRTDKEIISEIQQSLRNDVRIDDGLIQVEVHGGDTELSGTVGSASEKFQAEAKAWVAGVKSVNTENLNVKSWARDDELRKDKYIPKSDEEIKKAVVDAFVYDPRVFSFKPDIDVTNGIVTLTGTVDNLKAKHAAEQDARNVVGVFAVENYLKVRPAVVPKNEILEKHVSDAMLRDPYVDKYEVSVNAMNGIVYLKGAVDTKFEKSQAEDIAARSKGVIAVENNLKIDSDYDSYLNPYYGWNMFTAPQAFDVDRDYQTDWELKKEINSQLWWSPYVNENEVLVEVSDGEAVLSGTVDTQREKLYAEINALQAGAKEVENNIVVSYLPEQ